MAATVKITPKKIQSSRKFEGLNEDTLTEDYGLDLNQASDTVNWRITNQNKLDVRDGYKQLIVMLDDKEVNISGMTLYGSELVFAYDSNLYSISRELALKTNIEVGMTTLSISDTKLIGTTENAHHDFFTMNGILYIQNGHKYRQYDGINLGVVEGYIPTYKFGRFVTNEMIYDAGWFENINRLTSKRRVIISGDGVNKVVPLPEKNTSLVEVKNEGVVMSSGYSFSNDTVTFSAAPIKLEQVVEIIYEVNENHLRDSIDKCRFNILFGGDNHTRMFFYGNEEEQSFRYNTGSNEPTYFPIQNGYSVGSTNTPITSIVKANSSMIIFKPNEAYLSNYEASTRVYAEGTSYAMTTSIALFPIIELGKYGNKGMNSAVIIDNAPVSFGSTIRKWDTGYIKDERNAYDIGRKVAKTIRNMDMNNIVTYDYEKLNELWIAYNDTDPESIHYNTNTVLVFNYGINEWYRFNNIKATQFMTIDDELLFSCDNSICKFHDSYRDDIDSEIVAEYVTGFNNHNIPNRLKTGDRIWIEQLPSDNSQYTLQFRTNTSGLWSREYKSVENEFFSFDDIDFSDFSFETNPNPKAGGHKIKPKKYSNIQFKLISKGLGNKATILGMHYRYKVGTLIK